MREFVDEYDLWLNDNNLLGMTKAISHRYPDLDLFQRIEGQGLPRAVTRW